MGAKSGKRSVSLRRVFWVLAGLIVVAEGANSFLSGEVGVAGVLGVRSLRMINSPGPWAWVAGTNLLVLGVAILYIGLRADDENLGR